VANAEWYEIPGSTAEYPNIEAATTVAEGHASSTDDVVEIYKCTRTLVRTVQRTITVQTTDIP
jgi:hypothetical protein